MLGQLLIEHASLPALYIAKDMLFPLTSINLATKLKILLCTYPLKFFLLLLLLFIGLCYSLCSTNE